MNDRYEAVGYFDICTLKNEHPNRFMIETTKGNVSQADKLQCMVALRQAQAAKGVEDSNDWCVYFFKSNVSIEKMVERLKLYRDHFKFKFIVVVLPSQMLHEPEVRAALLGRIQPEWDDLIAVERMPRVALIEDAFYLRRGLFAHQTDIPQAFFQRAREPKMQKHLIQYINANIIAATQGYAAKPLYERIMSYGE